MTSRAHAKGEAGIGVLGRSIHDGFAVVRVPKGTGGYEAGLRPNDLIVQARGQRIDLDQKLAPLSRGEACTWVRLRVRRRTKAGLRERLFEVQRVPKGGSCAKTIDCGTSLAKSPRGNETYAIKGLGFRYETDEHGRPLRVVADLPAKRANPKCKRESTQAERGAAGKVPGHRMNGGHLIGHRFSGPGDDINVVAMPARLNTGPWKVMENTWASQLETGHRLHICIEVAWADPAFAGSEGAAKLIENRPIAFDVVYYATDRNGEWVGAPVREVFQNLPGTKAGGAKVQRVGFDAAPPVRCMSHAFEWESPTRG
ncbi:MAG: DNA/RNA non-specific endonuclease [Deltaproteobacteria bacterium]